MYIESMSVHFEKNKRIVIRTNENKEMVLDKNDLFVKCKDSIISNLDKDEINAEIKKRVNNYEKKVNSLDVNDKEKLRLILENSTKEKKDFYKKLAVDYLAEKKSLKMSQEVLSKYLNKIMIVMNEIINEEKLMEV